MNLLEDVKRSSALSLIKDPFKSDLVEGIDIRYTKGMFHPHTPFWYARISFENGNTKGSQRTKDYPTLEEVLCEIKIILESVKA